MLGSMVALITGVSKLQLRRYGSLRVVPTPYAKTGALRLGMPPLVEAIITEVSKEANGACESLTLATEKLTSNDQYCKYPPPYHE